MSIKRIFTALMLCVSVVGLFSCNTSEDEPLPNEPGDNIENEGGDDEGDKNEGEMKTLIVYFSFTAGNTKSIAEKIHKEIGGDIERLETAVPYPDDYDEAVSQGQQEVSSGYKPELKPLNVDVKDYDRIIVGTPTWWYKMSPAVLSFLSSTDFTGKTVVPFMTNSGWPGTVIEDMTTVAEGNGATVENAHEFRFSSNSSHYDQMVTSQEELDEWIESLK